MTVYALIALGLVVLILAGLPVGFAAATGAMLGAGVFFGDLADPRVASMIARLFLDRIDSFLLLAIPFFLLAGRLMNTGGITERLFGFVSLTVRPFRGGLGHANVLASTLFAGMSGSATADAVGLGQVEMRAMLSEGYDRHFSAGITAASSLIGPIIPPSIALIAYGVSAEVSIGAMFMAGIVPGLILTLAFMAYVAVLAHVHRMPKAAMAPWGELGRAFRRALLPLLMPVIIIGGIRGGIFTPTEAAAIAAFYAILLACLVYREIGPWQLLLEVRQAMLDSAAIMLIIAFTAAFGVVMIHGQVPQGLARTMAGLTDSATVLMLLLMLVWVVVGLFMAQTPALLVLTPILVPTATLFGIDLVHFGIVMALCLTVGLLTPPVGMVLFALVKVTGVSYGRLAWVVLPYIAIVLGVCVLLILVPDLVLFLPRITG